MSGSILIGWPNHVQSSTFSGGAWREALPLSNIATREPWAVARSVNRDLESTQFSINLGRVRNLRAIALGNHNLSQSAAWRIKIGSTAGGSNIYDSNWQAVWSMAFDGDLLTWEGSSLWEGVVDDPSEYVGHPYLALHVLPDWKNARYITIEIDDTLNPRGYVQLGQVFVGGGFRPKFSASYGLQDSWIDATQITENENGYAFGDVRRRRRKVQFATEWLSKTEAAVAYEMQRRQGVWGQVLWVPYPFSQQESQRYGFIGRMTELSPIDYPYFNTRSVGWTITEI